MKISINHTKHFDHRKLAKMFRKLWENEKRWNKRNIPGYTNENAEWSKRRYQMLKNRPGKFDPYSTL